MPSPRWCRFIPVSSKRFIGLTLLFRSSVYIELIFVFSMRQGSKSFLWRVNVQGLGLVFFFFFFLIFASFDERLFFLLLNCLGVLVKNQSTITPWLYSWTLDSILLTCVSLSVQHSPCYCNFVVTTL